MNKTQNPDRLQALWNRQAEFQLNFVDFDTMSDVEKVAFTKENMLALHREIGELLNELPWKVHRAKTIEYDIDKVREEMIDCFKYMLNLAITWGMTADMFVELFNKKTDLVLQRYEAEKHSL